MKREKASLAVREEGNEAPDASGAGLGSKEHGPEESSTAIRAALRRELKHHPPGSIDTAIKRSEGYLNKFCRGDSTVSIDLLLLTLERMGVSPGRFFANALAAPRTRDAALEDLARHGRLASGLERIERVARRLAREAQDESPSTPAPANSTEPTALLEQVLGCGIQEQRRRLRTARRYRTAAFARGYLEHLDARRYDRPREAARTAQIVALKLVPELPAPPAERLALELEALGVYASAQRMLGQFATAARALHIALRLARQANHGRLVAKLLQRAAYVLSDHARFDEAMEILDEAMVIYFDLEARLELGMVLVDRGFISNYKGEYEAAIKYLRRGLAIVTKEPECRPRTIVAGHQVLALAFRNAGDLEQADTSLVQAVDQFRDQGDINWAKLVWLHGDIAFARGTFSQAEYRFRQAKAVFDGTQSPDSALVSLDLARALLAQNKLVQANELAVQFAEYLRLFGRSKVISAAVTAFVRTALEGQVSMGRIEQLQRKIRGTLAQTKRP